MTLVKYNKGKWRSEKQYKFIQRWITGRSRDVLQSFGIDLKDGQFDIDLMGMITTTRKYGPTTRKSCDYILICDSEGVVAQYKLTSTAKVVNGICIWTDPTGPELKWERQFTNPK